MLPQTPFEKPLRSLRSKVLSAISWITGISLGSFLLLIAIVLVAFTLFARTETFQNGLRDRILVYAQKQMGASITFEQANVSVFRLEPRIDFLKVKLSNPKIANPVGLERVSVGINVLFSLPLLLFKRLSISSVELEGLDYRIDNYLQINRWLDTFRPRHRTFVPSAFQTAVETIRLKRVDFDVDLQIPNSPAAFKKVKGFLAVDSVTITLSAEETHFFGSMRFEKLEGEHWGPISGALQVREGINGKSGTRLSDLKITSGENSFELNGEIKQWADPILDLDGKLKISPGGFLPAKLGVQGLVNCGFRLKGNYKNLNGTGALTANPLSINNRRFENLSVDWKLEHSELHLQHLAWAAGEEKVTGTGKIDLNSPEATSAVDLDLQSVQLPEYLHLVGPPFKNWKAGISGKVHTEWQGFKNFAPHSNFDLSVQELEIRSPRDNNEIFALPSAKINGNFAWDISKRGQFDATVVTHDNSSFWKGGAHWNTETFDMSWTADCYDKMIGRLFSRDLAVKGRLVGSLKGPVHDLELNVDPDLEKFTMNGFSFHQLRGRLNLRHRVLSGMPLVAKEVQARGGFYLPEGLPDEFSNLHVSAQDLDLDFFEKILHKSGAPAPKPLGIAGHVKMKADLNGLIDMPSASGIFEISDWALRGDKSRGRHARGNFAVSKGVVFVQDLAVQMAEGSSPITLDLRVDKGGISDFSAQGKEVRISDWIYLTGLDLPIQGRSEFEIDYQRDLPSLTLAMKITRASLSGIAQKDSEIALNWDRDDLTYSGNLFGGVAHLEGKAHGANAEMNHQLSLELDAFNLVSLVPGASQSRLLMPVSAVGGFKWSTPPIPTRLEALGDLFLKARKLTGSLEVNRAFMQLGSVQFQRIDPFKILVSPNSNGLGSRWTMQETKISSDEGQLQVSGFYENNRSYQMNLNGKTNLRSVASFLPALSRSEGELAIGGLINTEGFTGTLAVSRGLIALQDSPLILRAVEAQIRATKSQFEVQQMRAELKEGTISASGRFRLTDWQKISTNLQLQLESTLIQPTEGLQFRASGPVTLVVNDEEGELSGNLGISEGSYRQRLDLRSDLVKFLQPKKREFKRPESQESIWTKWKLNLRMTTREPFSIRNNLAEGLANANILVGGTFGDPQVKGSIDIVRGEFSYNNRQFNIISGSIAFVDQKSNIPNYDIRAETDVDIYRVSIQLTGGPDLQRIRYTAEPQLGEKEILSLLSFGQTPNADPLSPRESKDDPRLQAAYTGISFVTGQIQDQLEGHLSKGLGIQRFTLLPSFYEETGKTELQLTVGTDLVLNKLALNYATYVSTTGGQKVELDYRVNRFTHVVGSWRDVETESTGDFGGDLRFRFEFE